MSKGMRPFSVCHRGLPILLKQRTFPPENLKLDGERDMELAFDDFLKVDLRVGTILAARRHPKSRKASYQLEIDFGPLGTRQSSAQITHHYSPADLVGRQILAVVNFPSKTIGGFRSEVLVLGAYDAAGDVVLLSPACASLDMFTDYADRGRCFEKVVNLLEVTE